MLDTAARRVEKKVLEERRGCVMVIVLDTAVRRALPGCTAAFIRLLSARSARSGNAAFL